MTNNSEFDAIFESIMGGALTVMDPHKDTLGSRGLDPLETLMNAITQLGTKHETESGIVIDDGVYVEHGKYDKEEGIVIKKLKTAHQFEGQGLEDAVMGQIMDLTNEAGVKLFYVPDGEHEGSADWWSQMGFEQQMANTDLDTPDCMVYSGKKIKAE